MKSETMLPLGKVDPGLREPDTPLDVRTIAEGAEQIDFLGYDGIAVEECKDDPYQQLTLASVNTNELELATSIAMAFPRSPTISLYLHPAKTSPWSRIMKRLQELPSISWQRRCKSTVL